MALNQTYFSRAGKSSSKSMKILKGGYISLLQGHENIKGKKVDLAELNKISDKKKNLRKLKTIVIDELLKVSLN